MKSVILQDVFSNLFLSVLMLAILALVLVGLPDDGPLTVERCHLPATGAGDIVLAFDLPSNSAALGEILWSRTAHDLHGHSTPQISRRSFVALMRQGCAATCRVCDANEAPTLGTIGPSITLSGCKPQPCRQAGA